MSVSLKKNNFVNKRNFILVFLVLFGFYFYLTSPAYFDIGEILAWCCTITEGECCTCNDGLVTECELRPDGDGGEFPELSIRNLSYTPSSPKKGDSMRFSATVKNWDKATADSKASMTRLRLDVNNDGSWNWRPDDKATGVLAPGETETETWSGWIAVVGTHKFEVCADATDVNNEANEDNNCKSDTFTVTAPDLIVSGFQIRTAGCGPLLSGCAQPGESLCARVTIKNQGNARARVSDTGFRKRGGLVYEMEPTGALDPGATETEDFPFTALDTARDYTARAVADFNNTVDESDEGNNARTNTYCVGAVADCPSCPSLISATPVSLNGACNINVSWGNVLYEDGYDIYRDGSYQTTTGMDVTAWVDANVPCRGLAYIYEVRPFSLDPSCPVLSSCPTDNALCECPVGGSISGRVFDSSQGGTTCFNLITRPPLGGATVTADELGDGELTTPSQANGSYSFSGLSGIYLVSARTTGYIQDLACDGSSALGSLAVPPDHTDINFGLSTTRDPWFQTQEGDVHAKGNITVPIADGEYFSEDGNGGTPGVVSYETDTPNFNPGRVSSTGWLAKTSFSRKYYNYFYQLFGSPTEDNFDNFGSINPGQVVYYSDGSVELNSNFPGGKAIILVNGTVDIKTNITVSVGDFLAIIASGKIKIPKGMAESVTQVEGIFIADGEFDVGEAVGVGYAFTGEGTFIANSFALDRDLGDANNTTPAEKFIYRPDFWLNAPTEILVPSYTWQELAP